MGDFTNEIKISKRPIKASLDWTEISKEKNTQCGNCSSNNVICIYEFASGCIIGWTIEEEYFCKDCNYYTLYINEYDS